MKRSSSLSAISIFVFILFAGNLSFAQLEYEAFTMITIEEEPYKITGDNLAYFESELLDKDFIGGLTQSESIFYATEHNPDLILEQVLVPGTTISNAYFVQDYKAQNVVAVDECSQAVNHSHSHHPNRLLMAATYPMGRGAIPVYYGYSPFRLRCPLPLGYDPYTMGFISLYGGNRFNRTLNRANAFYSPSPVYVTGPNAGEYTAAASPRPVIVAYDEEQTLPISSISHYAEASNKTRKRNAFIDKGGDNGIIGANEGGRSQPAIVSVKSGQLSHATVSDKNRSELLCIIRKTEFAASQNNKSVLPSSGKRSRSGKPSAFKSYLQKTPSGINNNSNRSHSRIYSSPSKQRSNTLSNRSSYSKSPNKSISRPSKTAPRSTPRPMTTKSEKNKN